MENKSIKGNNEKVFTYTADQRDDIFCLICDEICRFRAQYEESDNEELNEMHCRTCPLFEVL